MSASIHSTPAQSTHSHDLEEGLAFQPRFDAAGLILCVATDVDSGAVLMVAYMNEEALRRTIATSEAWYYSRSRQALWRKGEVSGQTQHVVEMRTDCDQDALWIRVTQRGAACHTGRRTCFYRKVEDDGSGTKLVLADAERLFNPESIYRK